MSKENKIEKTQGNGDLAVVMLRLNREEKELMIEGIHSAIAICDWDNYNKEEYENPKAQISWYYHLISKLNEA